MRPRLRAVLALLVAALLSGLAAVADATTVVLLSREDLVAKSAIIVRVTVGEATSGESDDGTQIVTRTTLSVKQLLKGAAGDKLTLEQFGGTYKGKTQKILGDAELRPGEDAVLFLKNGDKGRVYLTALAMAAYHVDKVGMARRDLTGLALVKRTRGRIAPVETPAEPAETVEHLMTDVVRIAGGK